MYTQIKQVMATFTGVHDVKIGKRTFQIPPGWNDLDEMVHTDDDISAKLPREDDWYRYGKVIDYLHRTSDGYDLWLFTRNNEPIKFGEQSRDDNSTFPNSQVKKSKSKWCMKTISGLATLLVGIVVGCLGFEHSWLLIVLGCILVYTGYRVLKA